MHSRLFTNAEASESQLRGVLVIIKQKVAIEGVLAIINTSQNIRIGHSCWKSQIVGGERENGHDD